MYIEMFVVMKYVYILHFIKYINKNYKHINDYIIHRPATSMVALFQRPNQQG